MHLKPRPIICYRGFTLVEILMVVTLIGVLTTLAIPSHMWLADRAAFAGCVSRLRILHVGFNNYMQENNMIWPQMPQGATTKFPSESDEWKWWYMTLKNYGVDRNHWVCPGDRDTLSSSSDKKIEYQSSYVPTTFDDMPNTAFRWRQPWVIERGGFHYKDKGPNLLMPDGSIEHGPYIPSGR